MGPLHPEQLSSLNEGMSLRSSQEGIPPHFEGKNALLNFHWGVPSSRKPSSMGFSTSFFWFFEVFVEDLLDDEDDEVGPFMPFDILKAANVTNSVDYFGGIVTLHSSKTVNVTRKSDEHVLSFFHRQDHCTHVLDWVHSANWVVSMLLAKSEVGECSEWFCKVLLMKSCRINL
jgi:hypothetical protein